MHLQGPRLRGREAAAKTRESCAVDENRRDSKLLPPPRTIEVHMSSTKFPPPRAPSEAARIVHASVDPNSDIAKAVRQMVRASANASAPLSSRSSGPVSSAPSSVPPSTDEAKSLGRAP